MGLADLLLESDRILEEANRQGAVLRLMGGLAIRVHSPSAGRPELARDYADIDVTGRRRQTQKIKQTLLNLGYTPDRHFNALHGEKRLVFYDEEQHRKLDVFLDVFEMCHRVNLSLNLERKPKTLPLAELLLTKLQIVEINEKDVKDIAALILDHDFAPGPQEDRINLEHLVRTASDDWGLYTTLMDNLDKVSDLLTDLRLPEEPAEVVRARLKHLASVLRDSRKSINWRLRAVTGRRMTWYELPEEPQTKGG